MRIHRYVVISKGRTSYLHVLTRMDTGYTVEMA